MTHSIGRARFESAIGDDQAVQADLGRGEFDAREAGIFRHGFQFREGVGIAGWRADEHHQAESGGVGGRDAVGIGDEFDDGGASFGFERGVDFAARGR